jgi:hypothetical protein
VPQLKFVGYIGGGHLFRKIGCCFGGVASHWGKTEKTAAAEVAAAAVVFSLYVCVCVCKPSIV